MQAGAVVCPARVASHAMSQPAGLSAFVQGQEIHSRPLSSNFFLKF